MLIGIVLAVLAGILAEGLLLGSWWVGRVVLGIILALILAGGVLFAYICFRARAYKWGAGCLAVAVLSFLGLWLIFLRLPF